LAWDTSFDFPNYSGGKREREVSDEPEECAFESAVKKITMAQEESGLFAGALVPATFASFVPEPLPVPSIQPLPLQEEPQDYPFFHYRDFSTLPDLDPLSPLTPPGRVPNFPAKMQAILSRSDLSDIIAWMPHGRSWRVLKPREFEVRVIPAYFEHAKFSSFIRQANGWGFRRITQGRDRNSYYHPLFLRGLAHLCKRMKRPGVSEKQASDPDREPDLYKISEMHPVPEKTEDDAIMLHSTIQNGPKARVPVSSATATRTKHVSSPPKLTPYDQHAIAAFQQSLGASENQLSKPSKVSNPIEVDEQPVEVPQSSFMMPTPFPMPFATGNNNSKASPLAIASQMAFADTNVASALNTSDAASQFAAGFAAATALSQQQFQAMLASMKQQGLIPDETPTSS
jgi:hypothetical protein